MLFSCEFTELSVELWQAVVLVFILLKFLIQCPSQGKNLFTKHHESAEVEQSHGITCP